MLDNIPVDALVFRVLPWFNSEEFFRLFFLSPCVCKKGFLPKLPDSYVIYKVKRAFPSVENWPQQGPGFFIAIVRRYFMSRPYYSIPATGWLVMDILKDAPNVLVFNFMDTVPGFKIRKLMRSHAGRKQLLRAIADLKVDIERGDLFGFNQHVGTIATALEREVRTAWALARVDGEMVISAYRHEIV
jgi:hypothetical protein